MRNFISRFIADETGATAVEYGLIAAGIALAIVVAVSGMGKTLAKEFKSLGKSIKKM